MASLAELTRISEALAALEFQADGTVCLEKPSGKLAGKRASKLGSGAVRKTTTEREPIVDGPQDPASTSISPTLARVDTSKLIPPSCPPKDSVSTSVSPTMARVDAPRLLPPSCPPGEPQQVRVPDSAAPCPSSGVAAAPSPAYLPLMPVDKLSAPATSEPKGALIEESHNSEVLASRVASDVLESSGPESDAGSSNDDGTTSAPPLAGAQVLMAGAPWSSPPGLAASGPLAAPPGASVPAPPPGFEGEPFAAGVAAGVGFAPLPVGALGCGVGYGGAGLVPQFVSPADAALSPHFALHAGIFSTTPLMGSTPISPISPARHSFAGNAASPTGSAHAAHHRHSLQSFDAHALNAQAAAAAAAADAARFRAAQAQAAYEQLLLQHTGAAQQMQSSYLHQLSFHSASTDVSAEMAQQADFTKCGDAELVSNDWFGQAYVCPSAVTGDLAVVAMS